MRTNTNEEPIYIRTLLAQKRQAWAEPAFVSSRILSLLLRIRLHFPAFLPESV